VHLTPPIKVLSSCDELEEKLPFPDKWDWRCWCFRVISHKDSDEDVSYRREVISKRVCTDEPWIKPTDPFCIIMSCGRLTQKMQERSDSNPNLCMRTMSGKTMSWEALLTLTAAGRRSSRHWVLEVGRSKMKNDDATDLKGIVAAGHLNATAM